MPDFADGDIDEINKIINVCDYDYVLKASPIPFVLTPQPELDMTICIRGPSPSKAGSSNVKHRSSRAMLYGTRFDSRWGTKLNTRKIVLGEPCRVERTGTVERAGTIKPRLRWNVWVRRNVQVQFIFQ